MIGFANNIATRGRLDTNALGAVGFLVSFTETIITPEMLGAIPYPIGGGYRDPDYKVGNKVVSIVFNFEGRYIQKSVIVNKDLKVAMNDFKLVMMDDVPTVEFQFKKQQN